MNANGYPIDVRERQPLGGRTPMTLVWRLLGSLKRRWWIPLLGILLGTAAGYYYVQQMPPLTYISQSRLWIAGKTRIPEGASYIEEANSFYGTQIELMQSKAMLARAQSHVMAQYPDQRPVPVRVSVGKAPGAAIFILQAQGPDATFPRLYLEALMDEYLQFKRQAKSEASEGAMAQVSQQRFKAEEDLRQAKERLEAFQKEKPAAVMQEEENAARGNFARWNRELIDRKVELATVNDLIALDEIPEEKKSFKSASKENDQGKNDSVKFNEPQDQDYYSIERRLRALKIDQAELGEYLKPAHPKMLQLAQDIETAKRMIESYKQKNREDLVKRRASLEFTIKGLQDNLASAQKDVDRTTRVLQELSRLTQEVTVATKAVDSLSQIVRSVEVGAGLEQESLQILEHASPPYAPPFEKYGPIILGCGAGFVFGLGIVLLLVWSDDRLGSLAELRANVDCQVVGQVPELKLKKGETPLQLLEPDDTRHHFAESYRNIRSSLLFMATDGARPKTILITSAIPAEGKSTVTSNLARALAFAGSKVLLIEGDQRRGQLHTLFGLPSEPGLAEILRGEKQIPEVAQKTSADGLTFISRGRPGRNPGELFLGRNMDRLLQSVYNQYDYVLIDSAPILAADDTTSLAPKMDGVLLVVRNSYTSGKLLRKAVDLLHQRQVRVLGAIYNRVDSTSGDYNYYNYPAYYITNVSGNGKNGAPAEDAPAEEIAKG